jgi:(2R)-ethylmalonyl-CoA mutase
MTQAAGHEKDRPWVMRTYAGHSTAEASNALYRTNLAKGQTGLSVAFDLPTQTGYDPDSPLSRGEVGKVGVPVPHLGEMRKLFADIPLTEMNTSMTINAVAMWMLAMYQVVAEEQNPDLSPEDVAAQLAGSRSGTRSTSAATTCRRPAPRPCRSWPTR